MKEIRMPWDITINRQREIEKLASDTWNNSPQNIRALLNVLTSEYQLRDLQIERDRAISAHKSHLAKIDDHIKNCKRFHRDLCRKIDEELKLLNNPKG